MKKIILSVVFVFASFAMVNAENESVQELAICGEMAQEVFNNAVSQGADYDEAYEASEVMYQSCKWLTYLAEYIEP